MASSAQQSFNAHPPPLPGERGPGGEVLTGGQADLPLSLGRGGRGVRY